ncbi:MAG TPA: amidase family protein [archaeon]|nr:amidase family protein [archaeon]
MPTLSAQKFVSQVQSGSISVSEHTHKIVEEIEKKNPEFNHFNFFDKSFVLAQAEALEKEIKKGRKGKLLGVPVSVKDCVCVKGIPATSSSKILSGYRPVFDATVIRKAKEEGAIILGKTVQDEFGFGTFSTNVGNGKIPLNPLDKQRSCGGSSGGAAGFAALTNFTHLAIAESTGGSIAAPASFCGVSSITPTYGLVSRYGLLDYANSLDKIGSIGKTIHDSALLLDAISGKDAKDSTSLDAQGLKISKPEKIKIGVPKELVDSIRNEKIKKIVAKKISGAEAKGFSVQEISLPLNTGYGVAVYYLIAMSEASTNLAKYCGMRYGLEKKLEGNFNEYFSSVRSEGFGEEAKRRILIGTFARMSGFRDAYYLKAMKARTKLIKEFKTVFSKVDLLAFPAMPIVAPKFSEIEKLTPLENYSMDLCTVPANLCGMPHATINAGPVDSMPAGLMVMGNHLEDSKVASFASFLEALK